MKDTDKPETNHGYDYDLIVIGGGSGGLACAKRAQRFLDPDATKENFKGNTVAVLDYVKPTVHGTKWKLGGTCVNVGCIPKKLMHTGSLYSEFLEQAQYYGWETEKKDFKHDWVTLKNNVQKHIKSLNFGYTSDLRESGIKYFNALGSFVDDHTLELVNNKGEKSKITGRRFVVCVGGRPTILNIPGADLCVTSDDFFSLKKSPGKTLIIGAGYIALECAGLLTGIGLDATVMVRSKPLREFDQESVSKIVNVMKNGHHENSTNTTRFLQPCIPLKVEKVDDGLKVEYKNTEEDKVYTEVFDTVMMAVGRYPDTSKMGLDKVGVKLNQKGKLIVNEFEQTSTPHIYGLGDVIDRGIELTPVAIAAGKLLAERLYNPKGAKKMDYVNVPTTVFTPLEYGACGHSEEDARQKYGKDNLVIYKKNCNILEHSLPHRSDQAFFKLICLKDTEQVIGFHYCGPNAGEVTQGIGIAMKLKATKEDFDNTIGIHPTVAENYTKLELGVTEDTGC